jgi:hypothetical protein
MNTNTTETHKITNIAFERHWVFNGQHVSTRVCLSVGQGSVPGKWTMLSGLHEQRLLWRTNVPWYLGHVAVCGTDTQPCRSWSVNIRRGARTRLWFPPFWLLVAPMLHVALFHISSPQEVSIEWKWSTQCLTFCPPRTTYEAVVERSC